jgi:hypothetical protein
MPDHYVLHTNLDLDVSEKCGEWFRGFKVGLVNERTHGSKNATLFYKIETGYEKIPYTILY